MKTLIIRFGSLGDLVLTLPALQDLAASEGEPEAERHFLVLEPWASLLAPLDALTRIWSFPRGGNRAALKALAHTLREQDFDRVLDFHVNLRSRLLRRQLDTPPQGWWRTPRHDLRRRAMLSRPGWPDAWRPRAPLTPVRERHRETVRRALGSAYRRAPLEHDAPLYPVTAALSESVNDELAGLGLPRDARPVLVAPGAAWPAKTWPHVSSLVDGLRGWRPVLLVGGPDDRSLAATLAGPGVFDYCGDRPLPRVAAALARGRALVGGDSGLAHLAEAVGVPVLTLFGPTVPAFGFGPRLSASRVLECPLPCRPCALHGEKACRFGHGNCLRAIGPAEVLAALGAMGALA
jgi:heptosyltransferase-2